MIYTREDLAPIQAQVARALCEGYGYEFDIEMAGGGAEGGPRIEGDLVVYESGSAYWSVSPLGTVQVRTGSNGRWVLEASLVRGVLSFLPEASAVRVGCEMGDWGSRKLDYFERDLMGLWQAIATVFVANFYSLPKSRAWSEAAEIARLLTYSFKEHALPDSAFVDDEPLPCNYILVGTGYEPHYRVVGQLLTDIAVTSCLRVAIHAVLLLRRGDRITAQVAVNTATIAGTIRP